MTISLDGDRVSDCETSADFTTLNSGANTGGDGDVSLQGTFAVGDKMSGTNELLVSDTLSGGASGVYDFSSGGADEGKHFIGFCLAKNDIVTDGTGFQIYFGNASGHNGSWYVNSTNYVGGYRAQVIDPTRDFDTAGTWTTGGNPAQLDDVSRMGFEFNINGTIMGSFNNVLADTFTVGFGIRAASNRFTFGSTSGVSSANDTITCTAHGWPHGTPVYYDKEGGSANIGLTDLTIYYINADGANTVTLHATRADGIADTSPINLTATGAETHSLTPAYDFEDIAVFDQDTQVYGWWSRVQGAYIGRAKARIGPASGNAESRFSASDQTVIFADELVGSGFYELEMGGTDTRVDWTRMSFSAADPETTAKRWDLTALSGFGTTSGFGLFDNTGIWKNAETITLRADCTLTGTTMIDCTSLVQNGATLDACTILAANTADGVAFITSDNPTLISGCTFEFSDGHAIEVAPTGAGPHSYTFTSNSFSGYGSDTTNDAALYINPVTSSADITITLAGTGTVPTFREDAGYTGTFTLVTSSATMQVTVLDARDNSVIENARVLVTAGATGNEPFEDSVTITHVTTTASVSHTAHGLSTGEKVLIVGANEQPYNGVYAITNVTTNAYDYTMGSDPGGNATGTITSTGVIIDGLTNASGVISDTRSYSADQSIGGVVRKATASPYFKPSPALSGTIDTADGLSLTIQLILDE